MKFIIAIILICVLSSTAVAEITHELVPGVGGRIWCEEADGTGFIYIITKQENILTLFEPADMSGYPPTSSSPVILLFDTNNQLTSSMELIGSTDYASNGGIRIYGWVALTSGMDDINFQTYCMKNEEMSFGISHTTHTVSLMGFTNALEEILESMY